MVRLSPFLPLLSGALLPRAEARQHAQLATRELLTCEQTYGQGWTQCGEADKGFCYNPSAGQTCCAQDSGYCDEGAYCAPVPGFCCVNGEDLGTCAQNAGFDLPASDQVSSTRTTTISRTLTLTSSVTPFSAASGRGPSPSSTDDGGLTWTSSYPAPTAASNGSSSTNSSGPAVSNPAFVQVSVAMKEQWTLVWMTVAIGTVGVFMATC